MTGSTADEVRRMLRRAMRDVVVLTAAVTLIGAAVGWLVAGGPGVWGGLIGGGVAMAVAVTTVAVMLATADAPVATSGAVALGAWVLKAVVLLVAFVALRSTDLVDRAVFAVVIVVGMLGSLVVDLRAVLGARVPNVEPDPPA